MNQRVFLIPVFCCLLGSCAFQSGQLWNNYSLKQGALPQESVKRIPKSLQIAMVEAPTWLNSRNMYYRLDYHNQYKVLAYSKSRWLAAPPTMLANLLVERLSHSGWKNIVGPGASVFPDDTLYVHLTGFQQIFTTHQRSYGLLTAWVSLIDDHRDTVVSQIHFHFEVPALTANAAGGAAALNKASEELADALGKWLAHSESFQHARQ